MPALRAAHALRRTLAAGAVSTLALAAACDQPLVTAPRAVAVTLELRNWRDTLVVGERRAMRVLVRDAVDGREVVDARVDVATSTPAVLGLRRTDGATAPSVVLVGSADTLHVDAARAGTGTLVVHLVDPRFVAEALPLHTLVVPPPGPPEPPAGAALSAPRAPTGR